MKNGKNWIKNKLEKIYRSNKSNFILENLKFPTIQPKLHVGSEDIDKIIKPQMKNFSGKKLTASSPAASIVLKVYFYLFSFDGPCLLCFTLHGCLKSSVTRFDKISRKVLGKILTVYLVFGKNCYRYWQILYTIGQFFIVENGQIMNSHLVTLATDNFRKPYCQLSPCWKTILPYPKQSMIFLSNRYEVPNEFKLVTA